MSRSSESARVELLREIFGEAPRPELGIGDDAAVLIDHRPLIATVDVAVEGVHFRRDLLSLDDAAARACEAAMSDVAAMGAAVALPGCGLLLAWILPEELSDNDLIELAKGSQRAARRAGTRIVGGNLARGRELSLTTTVMGRALAAPRLRSGARPGDALAISGPLGQASLGLRALCERDPDPRWALCVARWRHPRARLDLSGEVAASASACIDVSDGLALDASRLASASGVQIVVDLDALRVASGFATELDAALFGGEDYELLATGPSTSFGESWRIIGEVRAGEGVLCRERDALRPLPPKGWDHFSVS